MPYNITLLRGTERPSMGVLCYCKQDGADGNQLKEVGSLLPGFELTTGVPERACLDDKHGDTVVIPFELYGETFYISWIDLINATELSRDIQEELGTLSS